MRRKRRSRRAGTLPRVSSSQSCFWQHAIRALEDEIADQEQLALPASAPPEAPEKGTPSRKVFVVHGRDNDAKNEVARFLGRLGLEEIILHERANRGRHLLTKFQEESEGASFAVVLITPDDEGALVGEPHRKRARQNVVFELGFFIGKMGPANVAALVKGDVERPSDFDGIGYINLDAAGGWKGLLARELKAAGVPFDPAKVLDA
jgi:predicted nucleotide-binding protein